MSASLVRLMMRNGTEFTRRVLRVSTTPMHQQTADFKVKTRLKLRCRSCYFIRVEGRLHVECNEHPRHKQREIFNVKLLW